LKNDRVRLIVCGAWGRMGARVLDLARKDSRFEVAASVVKGRAMVGGSNSVILPSQFQDALKKADVAVDFSAPDASADFAEAAARARRPIVIGTTGFSPAHLDRVRAAAKKTAVFLSPNFSPGVNLLFHLAKVAGGVLKDYDAAIVEAHHTKKKDAPSGTALRLGEAAKAGSGKAPSIASVRMGETIGEHVLYFAGPHERLELAHRADSRDVFARGALDAALWLRRRRTGLFDMQDLMGLK
jgi:4-hydroxy-tetrahydrodipicolinate reductase